MISVTIKLHSAVTGHVITLGRMLIWNRGCSNDPKRGDYGVAVLRKDQVDSFDDENPLTWRAADAKRAARESEVIDYPRLSYNVWRLIIRALRGCFPEER